ncbi:MAG TPA: type II secretion system F family protein, partial [Gemmataceae bacterium]|nr:type II secretion system F family protein [Gemmataceae bacterium]
SQLADLLHSGVPLLRSLEILERQSSLPAVGEVLREVRAAVAEGTTMADAMAKHPHVFNELTVSMVRAGQEGGFLEDVLKRVADFTEHQEDLKAKVVGSLAYPVFLALVGTTVLLLLVVFVVPKFEKTFDKLREKGDLPALTSGLMAFSHFLLNYWYVGVLAILGGYYLLKRWLRSDNGRLTMDRWRLRVPGAGHIFLHLAIARFARILGTLLHNGIPILQSLRIAKDSTGNKVLSIAIEQSAENVTAGNSLAKPLSQCKYFPRDVCEMVSVAEESNSLETVLINIADGLEKRTSRQLDLFVKLLEPVMLLVMASIVLLVVAGLLLPIFKMGSTVNG